MVDNASSGVHDVELTLTLTLTLILTPTKEYEKSWTRKAAKVVRGKVACVDRPRMIAAGDDLDINTGDC